MCKRSIEQEKQYLADRASEDLEFLVPFVVIDPLDLVKVEDYIPHSFICLDLSDTKAGDFDKFVRDFRKRYEQNPFQIILLKNIDNIRSRKDKNNWKALVITGMKAEDNNWIINDETAHFGLDVVFLPLSTIKVIGTCKIYPDYLKNRGNLGIGPDFSRKI